MSGLLVEVMMQVLLKKYDQRAKRGVKCHVAVIEWKIVKNYRLAQGEETKLGRKKHLLVLF